MDTSQYHPLPHLIDSTFSSIPAFNCVSLGKVWQTYSTQWQLLRDPFIMQWIDAQTWWWTWQLQTYTCNTVTLYFFNLTWLPIKNLCIFSVMEIQHTVTYKCIRVTYLYSLRKSCLKQNLWLLFICFCLPWTSSSKPNYFARKHTFQL